MGPASGLVDVAAGAEQLALNGYIPIEELPDTELEMLNRHRRQRGLIPRGEVAIREAYASVAADGCSRTVAAKRIGIPKTTLDSALRQRQRPKAPAASAGRAA
ncbi:hypothetical protein [Micromonospora aurantiaca (nom. illeg.)]|uniref:hypothetical protein n=1 Tax=Micromonospora aurantiaca (nom. illeg.) TaxID=47850 RepID=UPI0033F2A8FD